MERSLWGALASLKSVLGGGLTPGTLLIIDNDNAESVIGGFAGLPQGGALDADATELIATIDTAAGDANDVGSRLHELHQLRPMAS